MQFLKFIAVTCSALMCALTPVHAQKRVALVIGNDRYTNLPTHEQLRNAVNDARSVGRALSQIGFEVISGENLGRQALLAQLDGAAQRLAAGDTVFFFFSGHGVAVNGANYILPADVPAVRSTQIASLTGAAIREEDIAARLMDAGARVAVVVLDACRNNPFASSGTKDVVGAKGLAPHEPPSGVFTLYAASRGEAALDRLYDGDRNPNSVFTRVLVPALARTDLDLPMMAREVREKVTQLARSVNHAQRPAYYDETSGDRIFLAGRPEGGEQPETVRPAPAPSAPSPNIQCGAGRKFSAGSLPPQKRERGWVLRQLTTAEAGRAIKTTQANQGMEISPDYLNNIRVAVHVDGTPEGASSVVLLPHGLTAQRGRRVEFVPSHLDPSWPCHYIPNLISRLL
jgi:hypothetical protein